MSITVVGSVALDSITSSAGNVERALGGSAIHFANAASLCTGVHVVGVVGDDFPIPEITFLKERGVDFSGLEVVSGGKTFFWKGRYEGDMNQAITEKTELNVFEDFAPRLQGAAQTANHLFLANIHPALQRHIAEEATGNPFITLDSMNYWIDNTPRELEAVLPLVDAVILNAEEVRAFTGEANLLQAGAALLQQGPAYAIIKKGEHGVLVVSRDWTVALPAVPLDRIVDPTGAGDSFAGALVGYLDRAGETSRSVWKEALAYATCVASFNVEDFSVRGIAALEREQLQARCRAFCACCQLERDIRLDWD